MKISQFFETFPLEKEKKEITKIIKILESNWYETVQDLNELDESDAIKLKIPYRFLKLVKTKLEELERQETAIKMNFDDANFPPFKSVIVSNKVKKPENYALKEIDESLKTEMSNFMEFMTSNFVNQQEVPVRKVTASSYVEKILLILGWLKNHKEMDKVSLSSIFPNSSPESIKTSLEYLNWLREERKISPSYEVNIIRALLKLSKFLFHKESKNLKKSEKPYNDIPVVVELRLLIRDSVQRRKNSPKTSNEELKWLEFDQFLACVEKLKQDCKEAMTVHAHNPKQIAWIYQKYLVCAILSSIPDRQRTLRELELNKTLFQNPHGEWIIKHSADDYKTGKFYGDRAPLKIREDIYPFLEEYLKTWRKFLNPNHNYFFSQKNGNPPTHRNFIYNLFTVTIYKLSGKKTNPHMIRDMIVTYFKRRNASESEMESLALYMGHSVQMQKNVYDRRSKGEKLKPAIDLMDSIKIS